MSAIQLAPGLYAIGATVPSADAGTWVPASLGGHLPVQCYALCGPDRLTLIDAGLAVHREPIGAGLAPLLKGRARRSLVMTRREPDTIINLPWLVARHGFNDLILSGILDPLDYFESFEFKAAEAHLETLSDGMVSWVKAGEALDAGAFHLQLISPLIRVLATDWIYERSTGTLFTSDFGAFQSSPMPGGPAVARSIVFDADHVAGCLATKFDWLRSIDTTPMIRDIETVFGAYDVQHVCPSFGAILEGRDTVASLVAVTTEALRRLSGWPRRSEVTDFDWSLLDQPRDDLEIAGRRAAAR